MSETRILEKRDQPELVEDLDWRATAMRWTSRDANRRELS
jgi:hypothetical protein